MANINIGAPSACYTVEKILEISEGQGNHKNYKVQWAPSWINALYLSGCDALVRQFLCEKENSNTDVPQDTSEEVKQECESLVNQNVDILTGEDNDRNIQQIAQCDQIRRDNDQGACTDQNTNQPVVTAETNTLCDTIKIEEDDSSMFVDDTKSSSNQVHPDTARADVETVNETRNKNDRTSDNIHDENYQFDRCITSFSNNTCFPNSSLEIPNWNNTSQNSAVQDFSMGEPSYLNYPGNGNKQNAISSTIQYKPFKHSTSTEVTGRHSRKDQICPDKLTSRNYPKTNNETDLSIQPIVLQTNMENNVKHSQDYISTMLQHPSKNLANISQADCSTQHEKHTTIDANNDNSTSSYTKYPKTFFVESDKDSPGESNNAIDTTGYKSASAYTSYPGSSVENYDTGQDPNNINSNERDMNRHSDITDGVNIMNSFETPVVNQYEDNAGDTGRLLQLKTTKPTCEIWNSPFKSCYSSEMHGKVDRRTQSFNPVNTTFNKKLVSNNCEPLNHCIVQEYDGTAMMENTDRRIISVSGNGNTNVEKTYSCEICSFTFTIQGLYENHMKKHYSKKVFKCNICSKEFNRKSSLRIHLRVHTGERPYACLECSCKFKDYSALKVHTRRTHTMDRPYKCIICPKRFPVAHDLKKHLRCHTGERPYACVGCSTRYKTSSALSDHIRRCASRI